MKRILAIFGVALALGASVPASAGINGQVKVAVASPTLPRLLYQANPGQNGTTGYVFALRPNAQGARYTLRLTGGATGIENVDAYFYSDIGGTGTPCTVVTGSEQGDTETGTIWCPAGLRPAWGVIVLRSGANATFDFSY